MQVSRTLTTIALLLLLGGCAPAIPAPTAEPAPVTFEVGDEMTDAAAKDLRAASLRSSGSEYAYPMADGTWVMIDRDRPLPYAVMTEVQQAFNAQPLVTGMTAGDQSARMDRGLAAQSEIAASTGKKVVGISFGTTPDFDNPPDLFLGWMAFGALSPGPAPADENMSVVIAEAEAFVAQQPDAGRWLIVVQER